MSGREDFFSVQYTGLEAGTGLEAVAQVLSEEEISAGAELVFQEVAERQDVGAVMLSHAELVKHVSHDLSVPLQNARKMVVYMETLYRNDLVSLGYKFAGSSSI